MVVGYVIRKNEYYDSVFLMRVAKRLSEQKGIVQAAALMGTDKNKGLLAEIGMAGVEISGSTPSDLIVAIKADSQEALTSVLENIDQWLHTDQNSGGTSLFHTLDEAMTVLPHSNLAVISVPGQYASREALKALEHGLNVFLFSDNVPIESERSLKEYARDHSLIVMGPDCGTAIIGGVGVGFANVVRRGPIGVIGASGTGIQEFSTLVHLSGSGISHAIGTGSRDLSDAIGGISLLSAFDALESDTSTKVIVILSKPPGRLALSKIVSRIIHCQKPVITCFLGLREDPSYANSRFRTVHTLEEAVSVAVEIAVGYPLPRFDPDSSDIRALIQAERAGKKSEQRYIRGLFGGGTFCYQAQQILQDTGIVVHSNVPLNGNLRLVDPMKSHEHTLVDMGADEFTAGRPHPMIDPCLRFERILFEAQDPEMAILLLDFVLGFNSSRDPAGDLVSAIVEAKREVRNRGGSLSVIASVCGTEGDPQNLQQQVNLLKEAGVVVFSSSGQAARFCALLVSSPWEVSCAQQTG